jgi:hypothetical protein
MAAPGVGEINYEIGDAIPAEAFLLPAMAEFGHGIYL